MKKNTPRKAPPKNKKPFFAHLLEDQELEKAAGGGCGGTVQTQKYPSDSDEGGPIFVTLKYPSDNDESAGT